jgi:hypothetical protein
VKAALFVCVLALAVPCVAVAGESPAPAVSACKAEYEQLGADKFAAKYGAGDAGIRACVAAHGGTVAPPAPVASGPEAECKAEYLRIGADAFKAKYGVEAFGACVKARGGTLTPTKPVEPVGAEAACKAEYLKLGEAAFKEKYGAREAFGACVKAAAGAKTPSASDVVAGLAKTLCSAKLRASDKETGKERFAACVKATLPKLRELVSRCKASSGDDRAFKQCVAAGVKTARAR